VSHPASCTMGTGSFPGVKRPVRDAHPSPLLVPWSWKSRAITLLPLWAVRPVQSLSACTRVTFTLPQCLYKGDLYLYLFNLYIRWWLWMFFSFWSEFFFIEGYLVIINEVQCNSVSQWWLVICLMLRCSVWTCVPVVLLLPGPCEMAWRWSKNYRNV